MRNPTCVRGLPGRSSRLFRMALATLASTPLWTAPAETSMTKKYDGGWGGRTMYSDGATNSTTPSESSGRASRSRRLPSASRWQK